MLLPRRAALLLVAACAAPPPPPKSQPSFLIGQPMPQFLTQTMSGKVVASEKYVGQPVVLVFVATGNDASERTLRAAQALFDYYEDVIVVSFVQAEGSQEARKLAARLALRFPVVIDHDGTISRQFRVQEVPRTFVVDAGGLVRWIGNADMSELDLRRAVEAFPRR